MAHVVPDLPSTKASQAAYATYYKALVDDYDPVKASMTAFETAEMEAALALFARSVATKVFAVNSGTWNTADNWYPSGVPGAADKVLIGEGCVCTYDKNDASTSLHSLRVDGTLKTDTTVDAAMLFDTMLITPMGKFIDGTRTHRVATAKVHQWIIATANGLIDVSWDTFFQSRGIICMGQADVWGAYKTPYLEVATRTAPAAAATSLTLASAPENWAIGDRVVICATRLQAAGFTANLGSTYTDPQNEIRTLTSVSGATIGWTGGLTYSHAAPQALGNGTTHLADWMECRCYVVNITRNVVFKPDTTASPIHHRGHMMQMHNPLGWSMRDAEVADLGRTAKLGQYYGRIIFSAAGCAADTPLPLSSSPYWDGSKITFGPTFLVWLKFTASGAGSYTIVGTDEDGNAQTETISYSSGDSGETRNAKYFLTITSITFTTAFASALPRIHIEARARQLNENGVRDLQTGSAVYTTVKNTVNIQGRYPFHWHKLGIAGSILTAPPVLDNCSIHGSPGWGVAQHQSHCNIKNSTVYDAFGAGFVAEDGNETGIWSGLFAVHSIGNKDGTHKDAVDLVNKDPARSGTAYWFTGRIIHAVDCIAVGSFGGFVYNVRHQNVQLLSTQHDQPTSLRGSVSTQIDDAAIGHFTDCSSIACNGSFRVIKANQNQNHDLRTVLLRFKAWSTAEVLAITYTQHYSMIDTHGLRGFIDVGTGGGAPQTVGIITDDNNSSDQFMIHPVLEGFTYGIDLNHNNTISAFVTDPQNGRVVVAPTFISCTNSYRNYNSDIDLLYVEADIGAGPATLGPLTLTNMGSSIYRVTATKTYELGTISFAFGQESFVYDPNASQSLATRYTQLGYWTDTGDGNKKKLVTDEWFSSPVTGIMDKVRHVIDMTGFSTTGVANNGSMDSTDNTAPVFNDFSVSMTRNSNLVIDVVGRASGNTLSFGGFSVPAKTLLYNNGDGTITAVPLNDENYSETCYVWVDDKNGNTTRATMTINVNKRALFLGRADLLEAA